MAKITGESLSAGVDLSGRLALVTGANSGLGFECARVLALRGCRVLLACRSIAKADGARAEINARHGSEAGERCESVRFDGDSMASVRSLVSGSVEKQRRVDFLVLNAGVFNQPFRLTPDGLEGTMAANYLGHFLLLHQLSALGGLAPDARVLAALSESITWRNPLSKADVAMIEQPRAEDFSQSQASPHSKVLLALMLGAFSRRVRGTSLAAVACVGAMPRGTLTANVAMVGPMTRWLMERVPLLDSVDVGVRTMIAGLVKPELAGSGLVFLDHGLAVTSVAARATDPVIAEAAWRASETALALPAWTAPVVAAGDAVHAAGG